MLTYDDQVVFLGSPSITQCSDISTLGNRLIKARHLGILLCVLVQMYRGSCWQDVGVRIIYLFCRWLSTTLCFPVAFGKIRWLAGVPSSWTKGSNSQDLQIAACRWLSPFILSRLIALGTLVQPQGFFLPPSSRPLYSHRAEIFAEDKTRKKRREAQVCRRLHRKPHPLYQFFRARELGRDKR